MISVNVSISLYSISSKISWTSAIETAGPRAIPTLKRRHLNMPRLVTKVVMSFLSESGGVLEYASAKSVVVKSVNRCKESVVVFVSGVRN